jgi:hypothetical protein
MKFYIRMSLGKIHIFGLYIPSSEKQTASHKNEQTSSEHFATIDASHLRAPTSPKGIKRSAQKVLHVKNRKVVASFGVKEPNDATCKQQQQCKSLDSRRRSQIYALTH